MDKPPKCMYRCGAGSYYNPLPWSECNKPPIGNSHKLSGTLPMCKYDAGNTCDYYENLCKETR